MTCSVTAIGIVNKAAAKMMVFTVLLDIQSQLYIYVKQKLMNCIWVVRLFVVKNIPTVFAGVERKDLLLAGVLLNTITRLCACAQFVSALIVQTEGMPSIRCRCYNCCLC